MTYKNTSLLHTNICSLQANIDKLHILFNELDFKFDIIAFSETWNPEIKKHMFSPTGTTGSTLQRGTGTYINKDINILHRKDLDFKPYNEIEECESCWIEIVSNNKNRIVAGVIYRHPSDSNHMFLSGLKKHLKLLKRI